NALGNQARTTACLPLNCESAYVLPSEPGSVKSGALSPTFRSPSAAPADPPDRATPSPSRARIRQNDPFIGTLLCLWFPSPPLRQERYDLNITPDPPRRNQRVSPPEAPPDDPDPRRNLARR